MITLVCLLSEHDVFENRNFLLLVRQTTLEFLSYLTCTDPQFRDSIAIRTNICGSQFKPSIRSDAFKDREAHFLCVPEVLGGSRKEGPCLKRSSLGGT